MAELLIIVKDRPGGVTAPKKGDVVCIQPDGWIWGECELGGPTYTQSLYKTVKTVRIIALASGTDPNAYIDKPIPKDLVLSKSTSTTDVADAEYNYFPSVAVDAARNALVVASYDNVKTGERIAPISEHPNGNHNFIRIIKLPGVPVAPLLAFVSPEVAALGKNTDLNQFRGFYVDFTKITDPALLAHIADDTRANATLTSALTATALLSAKSQRAAISITL